MFESRSPVNLNSHYGVDEEGDFHDTQYLANYVMQRLVILSPFLSVNPVNRKLDHIFRLTPQKLTGVEQSSRSCYHPESV